MVRFSYALYQHIINVHLHSLPDQMPEQTGHYPLVSCSCILQSKGHYSIVINSFGSNKGSLLLVGQGHWNLVVALEGIQETHPLMTQSRIHWLVYPWKREWVFRAGFVKIGEVYTHPPFPIFLPYYHSVREPGMVLHWPNGVSFQQPIYFLCNYFSSFGSQLPTLLTNWLGFERYIQRMTSKV